MIIKSEVSTLHIIIFSVVVCPICLLHHILSLIAYTFRDNRDFVFITIVQFMMSSNLRICFSLQIVFVCLYTTPSHYHHSANLSEDIELIKCLSDIFVECVSKIKHILSVIHYIIYGAVCFQFSHLPCDDWENINFVLSSSSNRKYELLPIVEGVRSWNNGMRCMFLYIPISPDNSLSMMNTQIWGRWSVLEYLPETSNLKERLFDIWRYWIDLKKQICTCSVYIVHRLWNATRYGQKPWTHRIKCHTWYEAPSSPVIFLFNETVSKYLDSNSK